MNKKQEEVIRALQLVADYLESDRFVLVIDAIRYNDQHTFSLKERIHRARLICSLAGIKGYYPIHALTLFACRHKGHWLNHTHLLPN